jgi:hypothetical protein
MAFRKRACINALGRKRIDEGVKIGWVNHPEVIFIDLFRFLVGKFIDIGQITGLPAFDKILALGRLKK